LRAAAIELEREIDELSDVGSPSCVDLSDAHIGSVGLSSDEEGDGQDARSGVGDDGWRYVKDGNRREIKLGAEIIR
jgi:hypothetical protein